MNETSGSTASCPASLREPRVGAKLLEGREPYHLPLLRLDALLLEPALDRVVALGTGERLLAAGLRELDAGEVPALRHGLQPRWRRRRRRPPPGRPGAGRSRGEGCRRPSGWPGRIHAGAVRLRPLALIVTRSSLWTPSCSAVRGESSSALSQVSLVIGLGSSWSQPLLAKRPSRSVGSGRRASSKPFAGTLVASSRAAATPTSAASAGAARGSALASTTPSCSAARKASSNETAARSVSRQ